MQKDVRCTKNSREDLEHLGGVTRLQSCREQWCGVFCSDRRDTNWQITTPVLGGFVLQHMLLLYAFSGVLPLSTLPSSGMFSAVLL